MKPPLFDSFRSFNRHGFLFFKPYILNYFNPGCDHTNAATEGLNNLIGSIDSVGNGYSFKVLRAKCLYASLIHERISYTVNTSTIPSWKPTYQYTGFGSFGSGGEYKDVTAYEFGSVIADDIPPTNVRQKNEKLLASFVDETDVSAVVVDEAAIESGAWPILQPDPKERAKESVAEIFDE